MFLGSILFNCAWTYGGQVFHRQSLYFKFQGVCFYHDSHWQGIWNMIVLKLKSLRTRGIHVEVIECIQCAATEKLQTY